MKIGVFNSLNRNSNWMPYAVLMGVVSSIALSANYTDPKVFTRGGLEIITDIFGNVGAQGVANSTFMCIGLVLWSIIVFSSFGMLDRRGRIVSSVIGCLVSCSVILPPYGVGPAGTFTADHQVPQTIRSISYAPPAVAQDNETIQYYLYLFVRWVALTPLFIATVAFIVWHIARLIKRENTGVVESLGFRLLSDDLCTVVKGFAARFWGAFHRVERLFVRISLSRCAIMTAIIMIPWSIWLWLMRPSNIGADTVAQIMWYRTGQAWDPSTKETLTGYAMSDHHPWLDTLLYGFFDSFGVSIGNEAFGLGLLVFLQAVALAAAFSVALSYIAVYLHINWKWCFLALVFIAFNPAFGRLSTVLVKDITSMPFTIIWVVLFIEYARRLINRQKVTVKLIALLLLFGVVCALTRKIAIYVIVLSLFVLVICCRKRMLTMMIVIASFASVQIIDMVAFSTLDIAKGGKQEMLAIPLQQSFTVLNKYGDSMNAEDKKAIQTIIVCEPKQIIDQGYAWTNANPVKDLGCFNENATSKDMINFMVAWVKEGFAHPLDYLRSVSWLGDYFKMGPVYDEGFYVRWGWEDRNADKLILPEYPSNGELPRGQKTAQALYTASSKTPILGLLMTEVAYTVWLPLLCVGLCIVQRRYNNLIYASPMLLSLLTVLVTPVHNPRYSYTLLFCSVLLAVIPFIKGDVHHADKMKLKEAAPAN